MVSERQTSCSEDGASMERPWSSLDCLSVWKRVVSSTPRPICCLIENNILTLRVSLQDVWCGRPAVRKEEVDPLLWGSHSHHLLCGDECLWPGPGRGWGDGEWSISLLDFKQFLHLNFLSESIEKVYMGGGGRTYFLWVALLCSLIISSSPQLCPSKPRTGCTRAWSCSTPSATISGSHSHPSSSSSTRRTCLKRRSAGARSLSATLNTLVRQIVY